ncbi:alpha/beta fold hydrolase [Aureibacter tunicatorum]|uniref:Pimeloyl-ACP methyl ester carboxylesterase n=1 Tax=Aureibacter tunicatorum TaxID=866807 RepID=A0AAE4BS72_9BACT|nr:alpha/beta fold hydrolase [Aureibacter tunicatorum]MDR6238062.1 pimeloyl-ACP methyl ester carboxylesterase [Aureibacter tunicatorum]BDD03095.1 alpha/beta hydrolase [Aureibacter tunicatorum]
MKLFFREISSEGQPLIIIHGLFGFSDNWVTFAKQLTDNYRVLLIDQRNHGNSPHSDIWDYEAMAEDLREFIEDLQLENPIIMGHSMGGKAAMEFAIRYPSMLEKLIVVDIAPKSYPLHHQKIIAGLESLDLKNIKSRQEADKQLEKFIPEFGTRLFLMKNLARDKEGNFKLKMNLPVISQNIANVVASISEGAHFMKPTLFIRGDQSDYILDSDFDLIEDIFSDVEIETVENAGHWIHADKPQELLNIVKDFID